MFKRTLTLLFILLSALSLLSQSTSTASFRDYRVVENLDSLEKVAEAQKNNPEEYLFTLIGLERSRALFTSYKFGNYLPVIDSLSKRFPFPVVQAMKQYLLGIYVNRDGRNGIQSLGYINKALELFTHLKDTTGMLSCYYKLELLNISVDGTSIGSLTMGEHYFRTLSSLAEQSRWAGDKLIALNAAQKYYYHFHNKYGDSIELICRKALRIIKENPQLGYMRGFILNNLANIYFLRGDYKESLRLHLECLTLVSEESYHQKEILYYDLCNDYDYADDAANAERAIKEAVRFGSMRNKGIDYVDDLSALAVVQAERHKYKEAYQSYFEAFYLYQVIQDTIRSRDFLEMQTKYETEKKEQANRILQYETEKKERANQVLTKQKQSYEIGIIIAIVLVSVVSILLFYVYQKNKQLDEYAQFRDQIFTIISHDLRSPVLALEGLSRQAGFLLRKGDTETLELVSQKLDSSVLHLNGLLNNLLAWAISRNTKMETKMEPLPLLPVINEIVLLYTEIAYARGITIDIKVPAGLVVRANRNGLAVIIRNLVDNAVKNASSKQVSLEAKQEGDKAIIKVRNNDVIISQELVLKIQNQLKGIKASYLKTATGLGLQLIAHFIRLHKGSIVMKSDAEEGTVFTVTLPA